MPKNIEDKLAGKVVLEEYFQAYSGGIFQSDSKVLPTINGVKASEIKVGPHIFGPKNVYQYSNPPGASKGDIWRLGDRVEMSWIKNADPLPSKTPLDWVYAEHQTDPLDTSNLQWWNVLSAHVKYFNTEDYNYTLGRQTDFQNYIRLLKLAPTAGIGLATYEKANDWYQWRKTVIKGVETLAYDYAMKEIMAALFIRKWEDIPSLEAVNDNLINRVYPRFRERILDPTQIFINNVSIRDRKVKIGNTWVYNATKTPETKYTWWGKEGTQIRDKFYPTYSTQPTDVRVSREYDMYLHPILMNECLEAAQRAGDLILSTAEKTIATQIAVEEDMPYQSDEDYTDPYENPFLVYDPKSSDVTGKPTFRDVSLRPGKQNISYTSNMISQKAWKKVPSKMREIYRSPDEMGLLVQGGKADGDKKSLLPLLALGAAGAYAYMQFRG